ncbi:MAG: glycosyl hydrolase [bacterium]
MASTLKIIKDSGAIPMITLEPWLFPSKRPVEIDDSTLKEFATVLKDYNGPVFLRFAHEMNGNWYPWSGYQNQKRGSSYIKTWHKVHDVITKYSGNTKIQWIWSINAEDVPSEEWNEPKNYYPGDEYVNIIGIDGYNFKDRSFGNIFNKQIKYLRTNFKNKTIFITEISSSSSENNRSKWLKDFFYKFSRKYSDIPLFIWFDVNKETNWNLNAEQSSIDAFKTGLKTLIPKESKTLLEEEKI